MAKQQQQPPPNPLMGKNIPPPPAVTPKPMEVKSEITASEQNRMLAGQATEVKQAAAQQEKATIELSLYLRPAHDDKLDDLKKVYKRRMKKKITANEVIRRLIENATDEDVFLREELEGL